MRRCGIYVKLDVRATSVCISEQNQVADINPNSKPLGKCISLKPLLNDAKQPHNVLSSVLPDRSHSGGQNLQTDMIDQIFHVALLVCEPTGASQHKAVPYGELVVLGNVLGRKTKDAIRGQPASHRTKERLQVSEVDQYITRYGNTIRQIVSIVVFVVVLVIAVFGTEKKVHNVRDVHLIVTTLVGCLGNHLGRQIHTDPFFTAISEGNTG